MAEKYRLLTKLKEALANFYTLVISDTRPYRDLKSEYSSALKSLDEAIAANKLLRKQLTETEKSREHLGRYNEKREEYHAWKTADLERRIERGSQNIVFEMKMGDQVRALAEELVEERERIRKLEEELQSYKTKPNEEKNTDSPKYPRIA